MATHFLGTRIAGTLVRFLHPITEDEFSPIAAAGLPAGWVAWHIEDGEDRHNSARVQELAERPLAVVIDGRLQSYPPHSVEIPYPAARWSDWLSPPFVVNLYGSDPDADNDDCWSGVDFLTLEAAERFFANTFADAAYAQYYQRCTAVITLDGPGIHKRRDNPEFRPSTDNGEWTREAARQAGMMGGITAYNDVLSIQ